MPVFIQTFLDAKNNFRFLSDLLFRVSYRETILKHLQANLATNQRGQPGSPSQWDMLFQVEDKWLQDKGNTGLSPSIRDVSRCRIHPILQLSRASQDLKKKKNHFISAYLISIKISNSIPLIFNKQLQTAS